MSQTPDSPVESDYDIDINTLMAVLGIEPGHVAADTARLQFIQGKVVLTYEVIRAVPGKLLALAMVNASGLAAQPQAEDQDQEQEAPTPIRPTKAGRRATAKKAVATVKKSAPRKKP